MAKIYVAASAPKLTEAKQVAAKLKMAGHEVTSRWLLGAADLYTGARGEQSKIEHGIKCAQEDFEDVTAANVLVQLTGDTETKGGRHSELGIALHKNNLCIIIGPREQVFHYHPRVFLARDVEEALNLITVAAQDTLRV